MQLYFLMMLLAIGGQVQGGLGVPLATFDGKDKCDGVLSVLNTNKKQLNDHAQLACLSQDEVKAMQQKAQEGQQGGQPNEEAR